MKFSIKDFFGKCDQIRRNLVRFTEEILNSEPHFLCSDRFTAIPELFKKNNEKVNFHRVRKYTSGVMFRTFLSIDDDLNGIFLTYFKIKRL